MPSALKQKSQKSAAKKTGQTASSMGFHPYTPKKGEEYMSKEQQAHFTNILELLEKQLVADRDATRKHMQNEGMNLPDILDRAALEEEHKLEWQAREREHRLIKKISQALSAIQQGDYGYCEDCGTEIGIRRLEARPTATQCIDCKTIHEIREKQTGIVD